MRRILRSLLAAAGMLVVYAVFPVPGNAAPPALAWLVFFAGLGILGYVVAVLVRKERRSPTDAGIRIEALVAVIYAVIAFFSLVYVGLASRQGQMSGLNDRVDALYFTMTTMSTTGFGDIHAVGKAARIVVTAQLFFDIAILGVAARLVGPSLANRHRPPGADRSPLPGEADDGRPTPGW